MIVGLGTDLVNVERFRVLLDRYGDRLALKLLSSEEMCAYEQAYDQAGYLAKRFAVKEATVKAMGTGFRCGIKKSEICVQNDSNGKPDLSLKGEARKIFEKIGARRAVVSISDDSSYALSTVILED